MTKGLTSRPSLDASYASPRGDSNRSIIVKSGRLVVLAFTEDGATDAPQSIVEVAGGEPGKEGQCTREDR